MKSNALWRCTVILPIAAVVASVSVSGCQMTTTRQVAVKTERPPAQVMKSNGEAAFERALSLAAEQRHSEAREVLDPLLQREPDHTRARLLHGVLRAREGRVSNAIEIFETLRRDYPDMSEPYNNLAVLYAVEWRLDDARKILIESLELRPDAVAYANLADVYTKLAQDANERARELDAGVVASLNRESAPVFVASETSAGSAGTGPREDDTQSGQSVVEPRRSESKLEVPARWRPDSAMESPSAAPQPRESVTTPSTMTAGVQAPYAQSEGARAATAETVAAVLKEASIPGAFCADAGGFQGRRAVADAALWLQSLGAEVIEVRHEERRTANSYRVYLPPFESRQQAVAKLREIRDRGVRDVAVIPDGDLANGISFGIYKNADNLHRRVAALEGLGHSVRSRAADEKVVGEYVITARVSGSPTTLDVAWTSQFPEQSIRVVDCG